jgi:hypothetical protein
MAMAKLSSVPTIKQPETQREKEKKARRHQRQKEGRRNVINTVGSEMTRPPEGGSLQLLGRDFLQQLTQCLTISSRGVVQRAWAIFALPREETARLEAV